MKITKKEKEKKKIFAISITQLGSCFAKFNCEGTVFWATRLLVTFT